jgi:hypothetical protein
LVSAVAPSQAYGAITIQGNFNASDGQLNFYLNSDPFASYRVECWLPTVQGNVTVPPNDKATIQTWKSNNGSDCDVFHNGQHIAWATVQISPVTITATSPSTIRIPALDVDISHPSSFGSSYICKVHGDHNNAFDTTYDPYTASHNMWSFQTIPGSASYQRVNPSALCPTIGVFPYIDTYMRFPDPQFAVSATPSPPPPPPAATCDPLTKSRIKIADMNGDAKADIFQFTDPPNSVGALNVWRSNGSTFTSLGQVNTGFGIAYQDRTADWDGDGDDDVFQFTDTGRVDGWRSNATTYTQLSQVMTGFAPPCEIRIGDMNGDSKDDIFRFTNAGNGYAWLSTGTPSGYTSNGLIGTGFGKSHQVRVVDMDGDGDDDLFQFEPDGNAYAWRSNGTTYTYLGLFATGFGNDAQVRVGDRDGDGDEDLFQFTEDGKGYYWRSNGTGYTQLGQFTSGFGPSRQIRIADINADAKADILWFRDDGTAYAWHGTGTGFTSLGQIGTGFGIP